MLSGADQLGVVSRGVEVLEPVWVFGLRGLEADRSETKQNEPE